MVEIIIDGTDFLIRGNYDTTTNKWNGEIKIIHRYDSDKEYEFARLNGDFSDIYPTGVGTLKSDLKSYISFMTGTSVSFNNHVAEYRGNLVLLIPDGYGELYARQSGNKVFE
jgi:hypothetical protein